MSREIKFRALNVSSTGAWLAVQGNHDEIDTLAKFMSIYGDAELMQYTGIKDINGREIYEGDIVRQNGVLNLYGGYIGEVRWREDRWHIWQNNYWFDNGDFYYGDEVNWTHTEVIGNIYETPELLKEQL